MESDCICLISIHASRGGSDNSLEYPPAKYFDFNPRFPWGKRPSTFCPSGAVSAFQSTLPVGEATTTIAAISDFAIYFNPRFPWGKRPFLGRSVCQQWPISIHASRGGSDRALRCSCGALFDFNPRFPWGKRHTAALARAGAAYFNPRFPWGKRLA